MLSVADVPSHLYGVSPAAAGALIDKARAHLASAERKAEEIGIAAHFFVREGEPPEVILENAGSSNTGLIVMGSHGRSSLTRLLMGSVTERVIAGARCPVLVARTPRNSSTLEMFPTNDTSEEFVQNAGG